MSTRTVRRSSLTTVDRELVGIIGLLSAVVSVGASTAPTGDSIVDAIYRALFGLGLVYVSARARRSSWLVAAAIAAPLSRGWSLALVGAAGTVATAAAFRPRRDRLVGAVIGGLIAAALLRMPATGPFGTTTAVTFLSAGVLTASGLHQMHQRQRRLISWGVGIVAVAAALAIAGAGVAAAASRSSLEHGTSAARRALAAARRGDAPAARKALAESLTSFRHARSALNAPWAVPARAVPGGGQQLRAVRTAVVEGIAVASQADDLVAHANYDRLRYRGRIDLAQVTALLEPTRRSSHTIRAALAAIDGVDSEWLVSPLASRLHRFHADLDGALVDLQNADIALSVAPALLGGQGTRHYFVAFTTPAELRGAGGFIGNYGELTASDGQVRLTRSGRVKELIDAKPPGSRTIVGPPDYVRRYGRFTPGDYFQDLTYSPNFPDDANVISQLYPQSGGRQIDGVIAIDPIGLAALLELTGPVTVPGLDTPLTAANAADVLLRQQYIQFSNQRQARADLLDAATRVTFERLTTGSLPSPRRVADALSRVVRSHHIQMWSPRAAEQRLFRHIGADGTLPPVNGQDALVVTQQNTGNNKVDAYLRRTITYHAQLDPRTGAATADVSITLHNDLPGLLEGLPSMGNTRGARVGSNVATLSVYTPLRLDRAAIDGRPISISGDLEGGFNVYEPPPVVVAPGASVTVVLHLRGALDLSAGYDLRLAPQPVANRDRFVVDIDPGPGWKIDGQRRLQRDTAFDRPVTISGPLSR